MKNNTKAVIKFLQANKGLDFTAQDVAQALSLDVRVVNGIFTDRKGTRLNSSH